jgi:hypothetical protein
MALGPIKRVEDQYLGIYVGILISFAIFSFWRALSFMAGSAKVGQDMLKSGRSG